MVYSPAAAVARGGLWTQAQKTADALRSLGVGVEVLPSADKSSVRKFDVCHVIGANMATYHVARELHRMGAPIVLSPVFYSLHSPAFLRMAHYGHRLLSRVVRGLWIDYGFIAELASWSRVVLPNTRAEAALLQGGLAVPPEKIHVVPNGVGPRFYDSRPDAFRDRYGKEDFILSVGQFARGRKNTLRLIRVLHSIERSAVIIGGVEDPQYYEKCRREAARNSRLVLLDALGNDSEMLASAYAACGVFVLPSLYETPGIAALEAGLAGAKVVITKYGGTEEYFGTWADYVDPRSDSSIAAGIGSALSREKSNILREHIRENFLWERVGERIYELYQKILA